MTKYCVDANVLIEPWKRLYPNDVFPTLYRKMGKLLPTNVVLIRPIYDELRDPDIKMWVDSVNLGSTKIDQKTEQQALELMDNYQTTEVGGGANRNDILLIAFAQTNGHKVVTLENRQAKDNKREKKNYKIPLICETEKVPWLNFIDMLRELNIRV